MAVQFQNSGFTLSFTGYNLSKHCFTCGNVFLQLKGFVCWIFLVFFSFPNTQTTSKECLTPGLGQAQRVKCQCDKRMVFWENFS